MRNAEDNKTHIRKLFAETAKGNGGPFAAALSEDVRWTIIRTTDWSRTYEGKRTVLEQLLGPLAAQFDGPNTVSAECVFAEGDTVIVQGRNHSVTKAGVPYPNRYCWVMLMKDGQITEITEYTDTQLITAVLRHPDAEVGGS